MSNPMQELNYRVVHTGSGNVVATTTREAAANHIRGWFGPHTIYHVEKQVTTEELVWWNEHKACGMDATWIKWVESTPFWDNNAKCVQITTNRLVVTNYVPFERDYYYKKSKGTKTEWVKI